VMDCKSCNNKEALLLKVDTVYRKSSGGLYSIRGRSLIMAGGGRGQHGQIKAGLQYRPGLKRDSAYFPSVRAESFRFVCFVFMWQCVQCFAIKVRKLRDYVHEFHFK